MRTSFPAVAVISLLTLFASSASAADCLCDRSSSVESCFESIEAAEKPRQAPMWCERSDDPRCMPAGTQSGAYQTLLPLAHVWARPFRWSSPPRTGARIAIWVEGEASDAHRRRVDRPPC